MVKHKPSWYFNKDGVNLNKYRSVYKKAWKWAGATAGKYAGTYLGVPDGGKKGYKYGGQLYDFVFPRDDHRYRFASNRVTPRIMLVGSNPHRGTGSRPHRERGSNGPRRLRYIRGRFGRILTSKYFKGSSGRHAHRLK